MITAFPAALADMILRRPLNAAVQPQTREFPVDAGPPISRMATTARLETWPVTILCRTQDMLATFEDWHSADLRDGTLPFVWRRPLGRDVGRFRFVGGYTKDIFAAHGRTVSFSVLRLPGTPWFAPYIPGAGLRLPAFVADYAGGVFGVGDARGVAGDLSAISGTYEVWQKNTDGSQTFRVETYSGDVPTSAPIGVAWLVGYTT